MKRFLLIFCSVFMHLSTAHADPLDFIQPLNGLLQTHVKPATIEGISTTAVDYKAWATDPRHQQALEKLRNAGIIHLQNKQDRLAFWINAYNLLTVELVIHEGVQETIKELAYWLKSPWTRFSWRIGAKKYTLDDIEHNILRPLNEPRIHFAINCASLSCPDLRNEAYKPAQLESQLGEQLQTFLANPAKGVRVDNIRNTIYLSQIFDWYKEDFANGDVATYLRRHTDIPQNIRKVKYLPYDWQLNTLPGRQPDPCENEFKEKYSRCDPPPYD